MALPISTSRFVKNLITIHEITRNDTNRNSCFALLRVISWIVLLILIGLWSEVSIVPRDLPREHNIFHAGAGADVMYDQITLRGFIPDIHDHPDMFGSTKLKIPRDHISGRNVSAPPSVESDLPLRAK